MIPRILILLGAVAVFGAVNWQIAGKEQLRTNGQVLFLPLAPVDPRSLMQGDYMALRFDAERYIIRTGIVAAGLYTGVFQLDEKRVGKIVRLDNGAPLAANEVRFRFRLKGPSVFLGTNAFFFQEGYEPQYRLARFGEFRVNEAGDAMLVDLRGAGLAPMRRSK